MAGSCRTFLKGHEFTQFRREEIGSAAHPGVVGIINEQKDFAEVLNDQSE